MEEGEVVAPYHLNFHSFKSYMTAVNVFWKKWILINRVTSLGFLNDKKISGIGMTAGFYKNLEQNSNAQEHLHWDIHFFWEEIPATEVLTTNLFLPPHISFTSICILKSLWYYPSIQYSPFYIWERMVFLKPITTLLLGFVL